MTSLSGGNEACAVRVGEQRAVLLPLLLALTLLVMSIPGHANPVATAERSFNIAPQRADKALIEFARQAELSVLFATEQFNQVTTASLRGTYSIEAALDILLRNTGIVAELRPAGVLSVKLINGGSTEMNYRKRSWWALAMSSIVTALATPQAQAQGTTDSLALEEVLVTAQKREQSVRDVPATVAVISADMIESAGIKDLFQASVLIPGTTFSRAPDDGLQLTIRGLGTPARTQSFDQSVALFLDGAFLGKGRLYSTPFYDVERIEVIKGTQSTLLGKNTSLGAISVVSRRPGTTLEGNVSAGAEVENGGRFINAAITLPASDQLRFRLAGIYSDTDGWVENTRTGNRVPMDLDQSARAMMVWEPGGSFDATASYQYSDSRRTGNGYQFVAPQGGLPAALGEGTLDDTKSSFVSQGRKGESVHKTRSDMFNLTTNTKLSGDHTLTTVSAYDTYEIAFVDDFDFGNKDATYFTRVEDYSQFSQEVRIASPTNQKFSYLAGVFYFKSKWDSAETQIYNTPVAIPPGTIFQGGFTNIFHQDTKTLSAFVSTTYRFTDVARLNLGVRYTDESKDATWRRPAIAPITFWNTVVNPPFGQTPLNFDDQFVNGNVSVQYDLSDAITTYAGYGRGTKTGGFAESAAVGSGDPRLPSLPGGTGGSAVKSEQADSYELGIKGSALGRRLAFELAAFYTTVEDFQNTTFTGASFDTDNLDVRSKGVESSAQFQVVDALRLDVAATYAQAEVTTPPERPVPGAPRWTGHVGLNLEQEITAGLNLFGDVYYRYRGEMVHQRVQSFRSEPWRTVDVTVGIAPSDNHWEVRAIVRNLLDDVSADFSAPPADPTLDPSIRVDAPSPLRSVRLEATYRF